MTACIRRRHSSNHSDELPCLDEVQSHDRPPPPPPPSLPAPGREGRVCTGLLDTISQKYESLDYDTNFNILLLDEVRSKGYKFVTRKVILNSVNSNSRTG